MKQTQNVQRGWRLGPLASFDLFGLTDEETKSKRFLMLTMAVGAGIIVALTLALMPESARTPWGDFSIAFGAFLLIQLVAETRISWRRSQTRRAVTRGLLAAAVVVGLIAAVLVPRGEQETVGAEPSTDEIVKFIEEKVLEPLSIGGAVAAGAATGNQACGAKCATIGAAAGAGVGIAINNTVATVDAAKRAAKGIGKAAHTVGSFLDNTGGPPEKVVQRDAAASTPNLPRGTASTPDTSSPQPTCSIGYGVHGRASCSWK